MKLQYLFLLLILILSAGNISSQTAFQGKVVFNLETDGDNQVMDYYAKDKKFRMEVPDQGGYILFDSQTMNMYIVMDEQKMYMESSLNSSSAGSAGSITKTGETKIILGYDCEKFLFVQDGSKGESWMTKELGSFMFFNQAQQGIADWQNEVLNEGYFPLQVTEYDEDGEIESSYTVVEVTPKELSSDMFVVPATYQKLDMGNMGNIKDMMK
ncbi:MAG: DUF4412 domain-containing protein [Ignavibacteriaceae bacterium]|nr:DUF4412 domain-containing protein [Ignavibacteriaceae bacterium]